MLAVSIGALLTAAALVEQGNIPVARRLISVIAFVIIVIALIGSGLAAGVVDGNLDWIQTYNAHFGPALRVIQGGVPMIDVFCQYGLLPYLLFSLASVTIFAPSYQSAAFVISIVNAAYIGIAALILVRSVRSKLVAAAAIVILTAFVVPAWQGIPASGALRFLPPLLVCLGLMMRPERRVSFAGFLCLLIASFWSAEGFAWSAAVFFSAVGLRLVYERAPFREWIHDLGLPVAGIALAHLTFAILWLALFNSWPRYDLYWELISSYGQNGWSNVPFSSTTSPIWLFASIAYLLAVGFGVIEAIKGKARGSDPALVRVSFPVAMAGLAGFSYWIARPLEFSLLPTVVPAVVLGALAMDRLCAHARNANLNTSLGKLFAAIGVVIVVSIFTYAYVLGANSVRTDVATYLGNKIAELARLGSTPTGDRHYDPIIIEAANLVMKYQPDDRNLALFVRFPRSVPVYLLTKKFDVFGRSNQNDERSRSLADRDLKAGMQAIRPGSFVFAESMLPGFATGQRLPTSLADTFTPFDCKAYTELVRTYDLCVIEESAHGVMAIRVQTKPAQCNKFGAFTPAASEHICRGHEWLSLPKWATSPTQQ